MKAVIFLISDQKVGRKVLIKYLASDFTDQNQNSTQNSFKNHQKT
jgi:hypothetical protein